MMTTIIFMLAIMMYLFLLTNPINLIFSILLSIFFMNIYFAIFMKMSWLLLLFSLLSIGGLMIIFFYMTSVSSNFLVNKNYFILKTSLLLLTIYYTMYLNMKYMNMTVLYVQYNNIMEMNQFIFIFMMILYLLLSMTIILNFTYKIKNPMRMMT